MSEQELVAIRTHVVKALGEHSPLVLGSSSRPYKAELYYAIVRLLEPSIVVETGVQSGISSAYILKAMRKNHMGRLYSIDLPDEQLLNLIPSEKRDGLRSGWVVPSDLRNDWELQIGSSQDLLEPLLRQVGGIGMFLHDSEHTYENMMREFELAWHHLINKGILLSDDINLNSAFQDFARTVQAKAIRLIEPVGGLVKTNVPNR